MSKRKNKALVTALKIIFVAVLTGAFIAVFSGNYRLKKGPVIAAEMEEYFDFGNGSVFKDIVKSRAKYFSKEGINTVIYTVNNGTDSVIELEGFNYIYKDMKNKSRKDIVERFISAFNRKNIQLFLSLDCSELDRETALNTVRYLSEEYKPAGIVIKKYTGPVEDIKWLAENIKKGNKSTQVWEQPVNADNIAEISQMDCVDGFICEYMGRDGYIRIKQETDEKILLHYTSKTMARDVFALTNSTGIDGAVVTNFADTIWQPLMIEPAFTKNENLPVFNLSVINDFTITYPTSDFTTYYKGFMITGTGRPYGTVTVNDVDYTAEKDGTFSIYHELEKGKNPVIISQNGNKKVFVVTKKEYGKSSGIKYELPWDDTQPAIYGQIVQTTAALTSMLSDPDDDSAIIRGMGPGTKLKVVDNMETSRSGSKTWAYKLNNGAYVMADKVTKTNEFELGIKNVGKVDLASVQDYDVPVISRMEIERLKNGDEILTISVNNMPAVVANHEYNGWDNQKFILHLPDAVTDGSTDEIKNLKKSQMIKEYSVYTKEDGTYIELNLQEHVYTPNYLWGWDISVEEGTVTVYLKKAPELKDGPKLLKGITIMLDPGHGGYDSGAVGVAVYGGPMEKDLNLAVSTATKALLEQWGAAVVMTREDDSFPSLDDRRNMTREIKPDLFIAQHHNSMDYSYNSTDTMGSESYYFTPQSEKLAVTLCEEITAATGRRNLGADYGYYYVTRNEICPAVLMEYSFINNRKDYSNTHTDKDIYNAAWGTLQAVLKALSQQYEI